MIVSGILSFKSVIQCSRGCDLPIGQGRFGHMAGFTVSDCVVEGAASVAIVEAGTCISLCCG